MCHPASSLNLLSASHCWRWRSRRPCLEVRGQGLRCWEHLVWWLGFVVDSGRRRLLGIGSALAYEFYSWRGRIRLDQLLFGWIGSAFRWLRRSSALSTSSADFEMAMVSHIWLRCNQGWALVFGRSTSSAADCTPWNYSASGDYMMILLQYRSSDACYCSSSWLVPGWIRSGSLFL